MNNDIINYKKNYQNYKKYEDYNLKLSQDQIHQLIAEIKKKKELKELNNNFVKKILDNVLNQNPKLIFKLETKFNQKSSEYKIVIKLVRNQLRKSYGLFRQDNKQEKKSLVSDNYQYNDNDNDNDNQKNDKLIPLLKNHSSTNERIKIYSKLYPKIFKITGKPKTILDLGCGLNPLSVTMMNLQELKYYAYDLSQNEIQLLNEHFQKVHQLNPKISGIAEVLDITDLEQLRTLPKTDICFLFKMTDILDAGKGHKNTEIVIKNISAKYIIISFSTRTMSNKLMNAPRRKWMEWLCRRLGYKYWILEFENELFYLIKKIN